jgi:hypothetical protein
MSGNGKGGDSRGNRRKSYKRKDHENAQPQNRGFPKNGGKKAAKFPPASDGKFEKKRGGLFERPKWVPPEPPAISLPAVCCSCCGKPIKDMPTAIAERNAGGGGGPMHFDCAIDRIVKQEFLERGDTVSYIGGGRFGIIHYSNPADTRNFKIKKILEWENKENRSDWRTAICDYYTAT